MPLAHLCPAFLYTFLEIHINRLVVHSVFSEKRIQRGIKLICYKKGATIFLSNKKNFNVKSKFIDID